MADVSKSLAYAVTERSQQSACRATQMYVPCDVHIPNRFDPTYKLQISSVAKLNGWRKYRIGCNCPQPTVTKNATVTTAALVLNACLRTGTAGCIASCRAAKLTLHHPHESS